MNTSECIQLATLIVVAAYTVATFIIIYQQKEQFALSLRPWIYPDDLTFENSADRPQLGIFFRNTGKLPAECDITPTSGKITLPGGSPVDLKFKKQPRPLTVYPHVQGVDTRYIFYIPIDETTNMILIDGCRVEVAVHIRYHLIHQAPSRKSYSFSANLEVEHFERNRGIQATMIRDVSHAKP